MLACKAAVVKLGGSLITFKHVGESRVDNESLASVSRQLKSYLSLGGRLIAIVHGGGSFGHGIVERIISQKGSLNALDAPAIQQAMNTLSIEVLKTLISEGLHAVLHHPRSLCVAPLSCDFKPLIRDYEAGLIPVTHGDAIPTASGNLYILSGDWLAAEIAVATKADCLIYATRVEGVYGKDGKLLSVLKSIDNLGDMGVVDTTGAMKGKVREALRAASTVSRVVIVNGGKLLDALRGLNVGTRVEPA